MIQIYGGKGVEWKTSKALRKQIPKIYTVDCIGGFKDFLKDHPENMYVFPEAMISRDCIRVPFGVPAAIELAKGIDLTGFLMDFTFKTNENDLVLGVIGPVGLWTEKDKGIPHMRFIPAVFMLSEAEDHLAHQMCYNLLCSLPHRDRDQLK